MSGQTVYRPEMGAAPLEPGVLPLLEALNRCPGVETHGSCQGHPERGEGAYVAFRGPPEFAARINRQLYLAQRWPSRLTLRWYLARTVHNRAWGGQTTYTLAMLPLWHQSPLIRLLERLSFTGMRAIIDRDLAQLARLIAVREW